MWCLIVNTNSYKFGEVEYFSLRYFYHHGTFLILTWLLFYFAFCDHVFMDCLLPWYHFLFSISHFCALLGSIEKCVCLAHAFLLVGLFFFSFDFFFLVFLLVLPRSAKDKVWGNLIELLWFSIFLFFLAYLTSLWLLFFHLNSVLVLGK